MEACRVSSQRGKVNTGGKKSYDPSIACRYDYYSLSFSTVAAATTAASLHCSLQQVRLPLPARQLDLASSVPCHPLSLGVTARKHSRSCHTESPPTHNPPVLREAWTPLLLQRSPRLLLFLPYPATRSPTRVHARTFARDVTTFCDTFAAIATCELSC